MKNSIIKGLLIGVPTVAFIFGAFLILSNFQNLDPDLTSESISESELTIVKSKKVPGESTGEPEPINEVDIDKEKDFIQIVHQMTHQKVSAHDKWGAIEITEERIHQLIGHLSEVEYENEPQYLATLNAWKDGDFSNVVDVHNRIWKAQGGNIGKAYGIMTVEEEARYVESKFR